MRIGVAADLMPFVDHPLQEAALGKRIFTDDEEGRGYALALQHVEDLRRPLRVGPIVERQRDLARAIAGTFDQILAGQRQETRVGDVAVGQRDYLAPACARHRGDLEDFALPLDIDLGTGGNVGDRGGGRQRRVRSSE